MSESPELLPCPFCGSAPEMENGQNDRPWVVQCVNRNCFAQPFMDHSDTRFQAIADWNTRADLPATDAQALANPRVQALVEALEYTKTEMASAYKVIGGQFTESQIELYQSIADAHAGLHVAIHTTAIALAALGEEPST